MATRKKLTAAEKKSRQEKGLASMWDAAKPASEVTGTNKLKVLLTGASGTGKSTMAAKTGRVLYVPTELQGIPVIQEANPDAIIWHNGINHDPPREGVRDFRDLTLLRSMLRDPNLSDRVDWVVIDGISDLQDILKAHYTGRQTKRRDVTDMDTWGTLIEMTKRIAREFRDLPVNVIVTALDREVEINGRMVHRPSLAGKDLPNKISQYFNLVGYTHVDELDSGENRWQVMFRSGSRYLTKGATGIDDIEPPEPLLWLAKRFGGDAPDDVLERAQQWAALEGEQEKNTDTKKADETPWD